VSDHSRSEEPDFIKGTQASGMSVKERNEFLQKPWIAKIACLKPDGSPYIAAMWYHWDGVAFWIVGRARSEWAHFLAIDPRVHLMVDDPNPPLSKVLCEGTAVIVEAGVGPYLDTGEMSIWNKIGTNHTGPRYLGERAKEYRGPKNVEPCWTVKIVPRELTTVRNGFQWARRYAHPELIPDDEGTAEVQPIYYG
jgi:pyridoxamine 5'-phosphate oxidase-like protein